MQTSNLYLYISESLKQLFNILCRNMITSLEIESSHAGDRRQLSNCCDGRPQSKDYYAPAVGGHKAIPRSARLSVPA